MAMFPCSIGSHRYVGKQQTAFFHVVENGSDLGGKLRLCPTHFEQLSEYLMLHTWCTQIGEDACEFESDATSPTCAECDDPSPSASLFAYTFSNSFPKRAFWGRLCHDCAPHALRRFEIAS